MELFPDKTIIDDKFFQIVQKPRHYHPLSLIYMYRVKENASYQNSLETVRTTLFQYMYRQTDHKRLIHYLLHVIVKHLTTRKTRFIYLAKYMLYNVNSGYGKYMLYVVLNSFVMQKPMQNLAYLK